MRDLVSRERLAIVLVTHDAEVASIADRRIRLRDGQIEAIEDSMTGLDLDRVTRGD
jgi:putative ABC transport system ATP-binding protein